MKFSIGDKIILKRTGEEGLVAGYIGKDMLEVEVEGTSFPVYADEIDHPYLKWFTEKNQQKKKPSLPEQLPLEKSSAKQVRLAKGVYLSFMPVFKADELEDIVDVMKVYLINELPVPVSFGYTVKFSQETEFHHEGKLHAFGNLYLHSVDYPSMNDQPRFHWSLNDASQAGYKTEEGILRIKPAKLFDHINTLLLKNEATFSYFLVDGFVLQPKEEKKEKYVAVSAMPQKAPTITSLADIPRDELDLHIERLISDHKGLSNSEIMDIQLRALQKYMVLAVAHRQERVYIIHGIGSGILKDAVHKYLKGVPEVFSFSNEWIGKYGYGATLVRLKY